MSVQQQANSSYDREPCEFNNQSYGKVRTFKVSIRLQNFNDSTMKSRGTSSGDFYFSNKSMRSISYSVIFKFRKPQSRMRKGAQEQNKEDIVKEIHAKVQGDPEAYSHLIMSEGIMYNFPHEGGQKGDYLPFSLVPCRIKKSDLETLQRIQLSYQKLLMLASRDVAFCNSTFQSTARNDQFVQNILQLYNETRSLRPKDAIQLTVVRNDYLFDEIRGRWMIVEYNTMAAGLGGLCNKLQQVHYNLSKGPLRQQYSKLLTKKAILPQTQDYEATHDQLFKAWELYGSTTSIALIVHMAKEKNIFDQRTVEVELTKKGVNYRRTIYHGLLQQLALSADGVLTFNNEEVGLIYLWAGYHDTQMDADAWKCRRMMELSRAIVIPSIPMQLINFKRAQQELCKREVLQKCLSQEEAEEVLSISTPMWNFEDESQHEKLIALTEDEQKYVLKPNRDGGGNNIYGRDIHSKLVACSAEQRKKYVLMERIQPQKHLTVMFKRNNEIKLGEGISQFGLFGSIATKGNDIVSNTFGGNLVRTKDENCNEGGVTAGFAVLDSYIIEPDTAEQETT